VPASKKAGTFAAFPLICRTLLSPDAAPRESKEEGAAPVEPQPAGNPALAFKRPI